MNLKGVLQVPDEAYINMKRRKRLGEVFIDGLDSV